MTRLRAERIGVVTYTNGEQQTVVQERHPRRTYGRQFVILFTEAMARAAREITQGNTLKVLLLLPEHLNFTDFLPLPTQKVAIDLGTGSGSISRAMKQLVALGIVEREGKGPVTKWRMSSDWGWNGSADQWHALRNGRLRGKKPPTPPVTPLKSHNAYYGKTCVVRWWWLPMLRLGFVVCPAAWSGDEGRCGGSLVDE